jgi:hypothetical protein
MMKAAMERKTPRTSQSRHQKHNPEAGLRKVRVVCREMPGGFARVEGAAQGKGQEGRS